MLEKFPIKHVKEIETLQKNTLDKSFIKKLQETLYPQIKIIVAPTQREANGLAMSSRNMRLTEKGRNQAAFILKSFLSAKQMYLNKSPKALVSEIIQHLQKYNFEIEYVAIINPDTFEDLTIENVWKGNPYICCAVICEGVRLIDNFPLAQNKTYSDSVVID
jgi:pantoate--beta-alanine ligase